MKNVRKDFPILTKKVNGHPLVYFDNAATTQKPYQVIHAMVDLLEHYNGNPHRGAHTPVSYTHLDVYKRQDLY